MIWDELYRDSRNLLRYPSEAVVRWLTKHRAATRQSLLDIGCCAGRHLKAAWELGYDPTGIDVSSIAVNLAKCECRRAGLYPEIVVGEMTNLPFSDESFQTALAYASLYYGPSADMHRAVGEACRVLIRGGKALVVLRSDRDWREELHGVDEYGNAITLVRGPELWRMFELAGFKNMTFETQEFTINGNFNSDWLVEVTK